MQSSRSIAFGLLEIGGNFYKKISLIVGIFSTIMTEDIKNVNTNKSLFYVSIYF
jgi:hypothetical protein